MLTIHRIALLGLAVCATACVDAPITSDQLEPDGQLRKPALEQAAFSARETVEPLRAARISAVLAAESKGALQDANRFPSDVGRVNLHLRADGIDGPRPVVFRWTHDGEAAQITGRMAPGDTLELATSFPIDPAHTGLWQVEVFGEPASAGEEPTLLFERTFEVFSASR